MVRPPLEEDMTTDTLLDVLMVCVAAVVISATAVFVLRCFWALFPGEE